MLLCSFVKHFLYKTFGYTKKIQAKTRQFFSVPEKLTHAGHWAATVHAHNRKLPAVKSLPQLASVPLPRSSFWSRTLADALLRENRERFWFTFCIYFSTSCSYFSEVRKVKLVTCCALPIFNFYASAQVDGENVLLLCTVMVYTFWDSFLIGQASWVFFFFH